MFGTLVYWVACPLRNEGRRSERVVGGRDGGSDSCASCRIGGHRTSRHPPIKDERLAVRAPSTSGCHKATTLSHIRRWSHCCSRQQQLNRAQRSSRVTGQLRSAMPFLSTTSHR